VLNIWLDYVPHGQGSIMRCASPGPVVVDIQPRAKALDLQAEPEGGRPRRTLPAMQGLPRFTAHARMRVAIRDNGVHPLSDIERQYLQAIRSANYRLVIANAYSFLVTADTRITQRLARP